jgi:hypothetical protein
MPLGSWRYIAITLQHDNALYRLKRIRSPLLAKANESRRFRLMEIQEEPVTMGVPQGTSRELIEVAKRLSSV